MIDSDIRSALASENFKKIEDIIDARKQLGQYNVYKHQNPLNIRCVYSTFRSHSPESNRTVKFDEASFILNDKEPLIAEFCGVKHTDSEITIVRVKCNGAVYKKKLNKWDMNDIAIPGDGTHLGESPSLVNLATLVAQNVQCEGDDEYLVPLSSWDPFIKNDDLLPDMKCCSDSKINEKYSIRSSSTDPNLHSKIEESRSNSQTDSPNNGRDATETFLLILPSFFYMIVAVLLSSLLSPHQKVLAFIVEFLVIVVSIILNVTIFSKYVTNIVFIACFVLGFHLILTLIYICCKPKSNIKHKKTNPYKKDYITNVRATINLISVIAILAVDFNIFPARFSKTITTGFSLMDVGVGLYVFANGIVAPEVKGKRDPIKSSIKGSALLLIIGLLRLFLTKVTHYKVSELEYGVHWNFFITLGATKILTSCLLNVINVKYVFVNAILLTFAHETMLQVSLKKWVFSEDRGNLISANKEGLVSTVGYMALYLYSLYFGYSIKQTEASYRKTNLKFFLSSALALTVTYLCATNFQISRRLSDTGYISWILFIGIFMMWLFYLAENFQKRFFQHRLSNYICSPHIFEAINYNGLIFFLLANVVTGLINLSMHTKKVNSLYSLLIISLYMFINCCTVFVLYTKQLRLKF